MLFWMQTSEREIFDSETMAQEEELQKNGTENVKTNRNSHHQEMGESYVYQLFLFQLD
jgi:hypothetical protein